MALSDHSAAGTNAGFSYQFERALHWLAKSPAGCRVGIETDDDVAVRGATGLPQMLEQDKHVTRADAKAFGDRSVDLWKTLSTWVAAIEDGEVDTNHVSFFMVTNKEVGNGIAAQISAAKLDGDVDQTIRAIQVVCQQPSEGIASYVAIVLGGLKSGSLASVVRNCTLVQSSDASAGSALRAETLSYLPIPAWCSAQAESILDEILGWVHRLALAAWQVPSPFWLARDHFVNQLYAVIDRRQRQAVRERAEHLLPLADAVVGTHKGRPFVRQLHLVTDDDVLVDGAIRDFLRCAIEKNRLSAEGNITDDDWLAFEGALLARWQKINGRLRRMNQATPERDVGFQLFCEATEEYRERLAGQQTDQVYLTSGSYHRLADVKRLGWHPRFSELLKDE